LLWFLSIGASPMAKGLAPFQDAEHRKPMSHRAVEYLDVTSGGQLVFCGWRGRGRVPIG
jgi:hypothetical protein